MPNADQATRSSDPALGGGPCVRARVLAAVLLAALVLVSLGGAAAAGPAPGEAPSAAPQAGLLTDVLPREGLRSLVREDSDAIPPPPDVDEPEVAAAAFARRDSAPRRIVPAAPGRTVTLRPLHGTPHAPRAPPSPL